MRSIWYPFIHAPDVYFTFPEYFCWKWNCRVGFTSFFELYIHTHLGNYIHKFFHHDQ